MAASRLAPNSAASSHTIMAVAATSGSTYVRSAIAVGTA